MNFVDEIPNYSFINDKIIVGKWFFIMGINKKMNRRLTPITNLGDFATAKDKALLKSLGIKHILNAAKECENVFPSDFNYFNARISDSKTQDLYFYFDECVEFIKQSPKILVHCVTGISRSCTFVVAYLMKEEGLSFEEALKQVKEKRSVSAPNQSFLEQLKGYESRINKKK